MNRKVISRAICSLLGGATLFTAASFERDIKSQVPLVCSEVYHNAYMYNGIPFKTCSLNERKEENLLFEYDPLDVSLTKADAKYVRNMPFDAEYTNAKDLKIFKNLERITILNYSLLSREELEIINNLPSLKEITILFNKEEFDLYGIPDVSMFDNINIIYDAGLAVFNDLERIKMYNHIKQYEKEIGSNINFQFFTKENTEKIEKMDKQIKDIVKSFNFDENTTEDEKIIEIVNYVTGKIKYDLSINITTALGGKITQEYKEEAAEYNDKILESVLGNKETYEGLCANYAGLTDVLGLYSGVDLEYTSGHYGDNELGHAWNSYNKDGKEYIVDSTFLDGLPKYESANYWYNEAIKENDTKKMLEEKQKLLDMILSEDSEYKEDEPIERLPKEKNVYYENKDKYIEYNNKLKKKAMKDAIYSVVFLMLFIADLELEKKKQKEKTL